MAKTLKQCLKVIGIEVEDERIVQGISCDSRLCQKDWIFVAVQGAFHHGKEYIEEARAKQAFILCEEDEGDVIIHEPHKILALLVNDFYDDPSHHFYVIGVTGTNGKTSTTFLLKEMLTRLGKKCLRIGTDQIEMNEEAMAYDHTTPTFMENLFLFLKAKQKKVEVIIMEVSSHAIHESRIGFIRFDCLVYTNISEEHLDYHLTMTHYRYTKFKARNYLKEKGEIILNYDRKELHDLFYLTHSVYTFGTYGHLSVKNIVLHENKSYFEIDHVLFETSLIGLVNVYNALCVCAILVRMNYSLNELAIVLAQCEGMVGRMEVIYVNHKKVLIDYAHSSEALENLLLFAKSIVKKDLITVLGCGGERDQKKRPIMALLASQYSRVAIFTEDNSRNEPIENILKDMCYESYSNVIVEINRKKAIQLALAFASDDDMIIIAGKGNEHFIIAGNEKIPYNDKAYLMQLNKGDV